MTSLKSAESIFQLADSLADAALILNHLERDVSFLDELGFALLDLAQVLAQLGQSALELGSRLGRQAYIT